MIDESELQKIIELGKKVNAEPREFMAAYVVASASFATEMAEDIIRLRAALNHIANQSCSMSTVHFRWKDEWQRLRDEAREALK